MREDMAKVTTERPRAGLRIQAPKGEKRRDQRIPQEDLPKREKIRQKWESHYSDYAKAFTDVLGPMYRFLLSQVGQKWDNVWSEICQKLPNNSLNTSHVRGHILDFVETQTVLIDGKVCYGAGSIYGMEISGYGRYEWQMYVHPVTGILCKIKNSPHRQNKREKAGINVPDEPLKQYHNINGVWYMVTLVECPEIVRKRPKKTMYGTIMAFPAMEIYDHAYKTKFGRRDMETKYGMYAYAASKRQLNGKEIDRAGLRDKKAA